MENFKIEIFDKERSEKFLFEKVQNRELLNVIQKLEHLLGSVQSSVDFFNRADKKLDKRISEDNTDDLLKILNGARLHVSSTDYCYLIWNYPNDIDRINLNYLVKNWNYVWYSDSDDAVVLFIENKKLILITHYGIIKYLDM